MKCLTKWTRFCFSLHRGQMRDKIWCEFAEDYVLQTVSRFDDYGDFVTVIPLFD